MNGRQLRNLIALSLILLFVTPWGAAAQADDPPRPTGGRSRLAEVMLPPVADAYVASGRPTQNFGSGTYLFLGYNTGEDHFGAERTYLRFDVDAALPDTVQINDARLLLYLDFSSPDDDEALPTRLWSVASAWEEYSLTWSDLPARGDSYEVQYVGNANGWYEWEVTDLVQDWVNGTVENHGVLLIGDEEPYQHERAFYSRETDTTLYPRLVIDYSDVSDSEPPEITVEPLPAYVDRDFTVSWSGTDPGPAEIAYYDVQVRAAGGTWTGWKAGVTATQAEFVGEDGYTYEFRARGVDDAGNEEAWGGAEATTTVDIQPPVVTVDPLPDVVNATTFHVSWSGSDAGSGIAPDTYDVIYRVNDGGWTTWLIDTTATDATFDVTADAFPEVDGVYEFEARAADQLGQQPAWDYEAEASVIVDTVAPFVVPRIWLPLTAHSWIR